MRLEQLDLVYHVWSGSFVDFEAAYREVAEAGVRSIVATAKRGNLDLRVREDLAEAKRILARLELAAPACHCQDWGPCHLNEAGDGQRSAMLDMHTSLMEGASELGSRTFVLHIGPQPEGGTKEVSWSRVRSAVDELAARAEALGLTLALENGLHSYLATNEELLSFVADYDCPAVGICYDSGHAHVTDDAASLLRAMSPYVVTVHLHDNDGSADQHLIPGQGSIVWGPVVDALAACPRLVHIETEAANWDQWPYSREVWSCRDVYARYCEVLGLQAPQEPPAAR